MTMKHGNRIRLLLLSLAATGILTQKILPNDLAQHNGNDDCAASDRMTQLSDDQKSNIFYDILSTYHHCGAPEAVVCDDYPCTTATENGINLVDQIATRNTNTKDWTFLVYMAADNDLGRFAANNIKQMAAIGSNAHINIVVQLDISISGGRKITRRYYIEKGRILHLNAADAQSQQMDSGSPETLISFCTWAITEFPAEHYALIFWNHGTGILDPNRGRIINATELFTFNPAINRFELDRSIGFFDFINVINQEDEQRGICWDDSTGNYLNNKALDYALETIRSKLLGGKKIDIIGFDACLMSMLEVADIIKKHAHIMVGSQEVELGTGWNYSLVLTPFDQQSLDPFDFGKHIVRAYQHTYHQITNDYTLSAINLDIIDSLEQDAHTIAQLLTEALKCQKNGTVKKAIRACRDKLACTHFDEPSYIDLHHFYVNLDRHAGNFDVAHKEKTSLLARLKESINHACQCIQNCVIAKTTGSNLSLAQGISIYFPERKIHASYRTTSFAANNDWISFLTTYLAL